MMEKELKKIKKDEKTLNELLVELERISRKINDSPLEILDKKIFLEFKERVYYSRDDFRKKLANNHEKY